MSEVITEVITVDTEIEEARSGEAKELLQTLDGFSVMDQEDADLAVGLLHCVKAMQKSCEERKDRVLGPLKQSMNEVKSWFSPTEKDLKQAEAQLKSELQLYLERQDKEKTRLLEEAAQVEDAVKARELLNQVKEQPREVEGITVRRTWAVEILDVERVPTEYLSVDESKLLKEARSQAKAGIDLPRVEGVRFYRKVGIAVGRKKK